MLSFQFQIPSVRFFGGIKSAFPKSFSFSHKLNQPFSLMRANTQKTGSVCFCWLPHVLEISKPINFTKISKRIVLFVSVYMVNMIFRPFTGYIQPSQTMGQSFFVVNSYSPVAHVSGATRLFSDQIWAAGVCFPNKNSCGRIVVKDISDMVGSIHDLQFTMKVAT